MTAYRNTREYCTCLPIMSLTKGMLLAMAHNMGSMFLFHRSKVDEDEPTAFCVVAREA